MAPSERITRWHGISGLKLDARIVPTARYARGLPTFIATSLYVKTFPFGIWRTTASTLSRKLVCIDVFTGKCAHLHAELRIRCTWCTTFKKCSSALRTIFAIRFFLFIRTCRSIHNFASIIILHSHTRLISQKNDYRNDRCNNQNRN